MWKKSQNPSGASGNRWIKEKRTTIICLHIKPTLIVDIDWNYTVNSGLKCIIMVGTTLIIAKRSCWYFSTPCQNGSNTARKYFNLPLDVSCLALNWLTKSFTSIGLELGIKILLREYLLSVTNFPFSRKSFCSFKIKMFISLKISHPNRPFV